MVYNRPASTGGRPSKCLLPKKKKKYLLDAITNYNHFAFPLKISTGATLVDDDTSVKHIKYYAFIKLHFVDSNIGSL